jgi:hypothetical protein
MGTLDFKILDNFLEKDTFNKFKEAIFSESLNWYFKENQSYEEDQKNDPGFFSLNFFGNFYNDFVGLNYFLFKIYEKINCKALVQSRANLYLKQEKDNKLFFHKDFEFECSTAIFYMNTNNGGTILGRKEKIKIDNIENRILIFNSQIEHSVKYATDVQRRIIININYF